MLQKLLLFLLVASWLYWLVAWLLVYAFFRARPQLDTRFTPPVSILKPVRGVDAEAYQNFVSFCQQDYPEYELLFGVADPADPVIPVIERLQRSFPERRIRLVLAQTDGLNRKASLLQALTEQALTEQALTEQALTGQAHSEVLVISDSDMRVTPDYLRRVVAPLADARVGLVTCPYRAELALTLTARLEALYIGVTFLPAVLVARKFLDMRFAMGATCVLRRRDLERMGGFAVLTDYLADDYQLGARMAGLGQRVLLSRYIVVTILGATSFREQWEREVRWARCSRVSRPHEYPGLLLSFSTPLAVVLLLVSGLAPLGWQALMLSLFLRWLIAGSVARTTGDHESLRWLIWLPVRDILTALVWVAGGLGRRVTWRGEAFAVQPDGRLALLPPPHVPAAEERHA